MLFQLGRPKQESPRVRGAIGFSGADAQTTDEESAESHCLSVIGAAPTRVTSDYFEKVFLFNVLRQGPAEFRPALPAL